MTVGEFAATIRHHLPYEPNSQQEQVIAALARFCSRNTPDMSVFMLCGYAGTGKTSLTGALVKALASVKVKCELLAPTGRAAKVFSAYAGHKAHTIHRKIYRHGIAPDGSGADADGFHAVKDNPSRNTLFIVDEASMIAGGDTPGDNILEDLVQYVYTGEGCRLLLLGDTAQLPPVGTTLSPAMDPDTLRSYGLRVSRAVMTDIARQSAFSGILYNATQLRRAMMRPDADMVPRLTTRGFSDVTIVAPEDLPDTIDTCYRRDGVDETILITRSNRSSMLYNQAIRGRVLYMEEELARGELLTVAKNNYYWNRGVKGLDFVANGDILEIDRVIGTEERYGFRFADVSLNVPDNDVTFTAKIMLETLTSESPGLGQQRSNELYYAILHDPDVFSPDMPYNLRVLRLRDNPHWNALIVKYAYAVTCHKAQGGQWRNVFVDLGYVPDEALGIEFYRWLYTAVTRARTHLYLIAPPRIMTE